VDSDKFGVPNLSRRSAATSLRFAQVGLPSHSTTMGDSFQFDIIPHIIDLEKAKDKDDAISIPSEPRC